MLAQSLQYPIEDLAMRNEQLLLRVELRLQPLKTLSMLPLNGEDLANVVLNAFKTLTMVGQSLPVIVSHSRRSPHLFPPHRACAALAADSRRRSDVSFAARAFPP
ncbi:MAG: hypothetical protein OXG04_19455 [Acidobacteria bacterium]|nr:hypothetical protein [Acidobacteriota bacterium]